ncbi:MAG: RNA-directed DNA polymerase [Magnetococcales bacterium]|nr:RNA-directed DNA polymerase [Magnetococcales bacterium]
MKRYALDQSPFFKLKSRQKLSKILDADLNELEVFARNDPVDNYKLFETSGGKPRPVQCPKHRLQVIHRRVCDLLARIDTPDYLHSAIKGHSYLSNAKAHAANVPMVKVDIKKFFPSVTINAVKRFFLKTMECSPDVAALLSKVLTVYGHLATGSSVSPILSYYAHRDMFEEIAHLSAGRGAVMTCYVDDMCFSGETVTRKFLSDVRVIIRSHGLKSHKIHYFSSNMPRIVTGVVVTNSGIKLPNIRHKKIVDGYAQLQAALSDEEKLKLLPSLIGRINEAAQIDPRWTPKAKQLTLEMKRISSIAASSMNPSSRPSSWA